MQPNDAADKSVTWTSSSEGIVTVSSSGKVVATDFINGDIISINDLDPNQLFLLKVVADIDIDNIVYERVKANKEVQKDESFTYVSFNLAKSNGRFERAFAKG